MGGAAVPHVFLLLLKRSIIKGKNLLCVCVGGGPKSF